MRGAALIVLAWNQWPTTRRCLESLLATRPFAAQVIVVDNGSSDATPQELAAFADRVRIVTLPENLGFVRGMNAGIAAADADADVVLLNNDLVFEQADWLERLRDAAYAAPEIGIVGCRQRGPQEKHLLYHAGGFTEPDDIWGQQTESGSMERDVAQYTSARRVQHVAFALAYLRRDCLQRIGTLDEAFHSYFEDTDYCLRAAAFGIATVNAGAVTLKHEQHGSTQDDGGFRQRLWAASRATFMARWQDKLRAGYRGEVLWQGTTRAPAAHAHLARLLVRRLDARGLRMSFAAVAAEVADAQDYRLALAARRRTAPPVDAALVCAAGEHFLAARGRHRLGLTWSDWTQAPADWVAGANALDLLLVPDAFQREAFLRAGVRTLIEILPLGVDADYCHPQVPAPRDPHGRCVFLCVIEDAERDAPERVLGAFSAAFARDAEVFLLMLVQPGPGAQALAERLERQCAGDARIRVRGNWNWPWHQRAQLLRSADVYLSARRGGGYDPCVADALACGLQLIASDFGSSGELARRHGVALAAQPCIDARIGLEWAEPEFEALVAALRATHRRTRTVDEVTAAARTFAHSHSIEASADRLVQRIGELAALAPAAPAPTPHRPIDLQRSASGQVLVLGMHRSGTSCVAGLLARMGVHVGPQRDLLIGPDNPKGHYESGRLHGACLRRLGDAGGDWRDPPVAAPAAAVDAFRGAVGALIDEFDAQRPWLFKEPRLCLLARELLPLLTRPLFVHVARDPHKVAASLSARDRMHPAQALALWERYTREAFAASAGWPRVLVDYDALCAQPLAIARELFEQLRAQGIDGLSWPGDADVLAWVDAPARTSNTPLAAMTSAQLALQAAIAERSILAQHAAQALRGAA
ncbi:glycosyltransferase [Dokdonella sp.]|uniref:glycosyltransferase n=1 Tax=Dokdonella sp. TaxID=2291710 RepID=UPI0025C4028D|nr:glycosyltransferase [Dokdonella sp.]